MTPFWLAYMLPVFFTLNSFHRRYTSLIWLVILVSFVVFVGFRHQVGGDWGPYLSHYESAKYFNFWKYITRMDPGYMLFNWISYQVDGGIYLVNVLAALFFISCLIVFCRAQPLPFLAFTVAMPYMIGVVSMGYTRQGVALGFVLLGLKYLSEEGVKRYLFYVAIAALFHKSAVILFPLAIFYHHRGVVGRFLGVGGFSLIMGYLFLVDYYDALWINYVESQMQSDGGLVRLLMNLLPSLLCFIYYRRIKQSWPDYRIWLVLALATITLFSLIGFASTAVDRVALYLTPIQLAVFSRLPMFFSASNGRTTMISIIIAYYALVLFVWFNYGVHSKYWLPYQNYITLGIF